MFIKSIKKIISKTTWNPPFFRLTTKFKPLKFNGAFIFYSIPFFQFLQKKKQQRRRQQQIKWTTHLPLKIRIKSRFHFRFLWIATIGSFWIPLPSWSPHKPYTPASLHSKFLLVSRVHVRHPSDFRLTFTNTVAVIHNKASCCFHFVFVQWLLGWFYFGTRLKVLEMT